MPLRRLFFVVLLAALPVAPALAQARLSGDPLRDVQQTMEARRLLAIDPELQEHNLGVIVRDRVATLWGPAPSAELAFRAELDLRAMIDLVEIRNELFVSDLLEAMRRRVKIGDIKQNSSDWMAPPAARERRPTLQAPVPLDAPKVPPGPAMWDVLPPIPASPNPR